MAKSVEHQIYTQFTKNLLGKLKEKDVTSETMNTAERFIKNHDISPFEAPVNETIKEEAKDKIELPFARQIASNE